MVGIGVDRIDGGRKVGHLFSLYIVSVVLYDD